jgi:hypothetical protein
MEMTKRSIAKWVFSDEVENGCRITHRCAADVRSAESRRVDPLMVRTGAEGAMLAKAADVPRETGQRRHCPCAVLLLPTTENRLRP